MSYRSVLVVAALAAGCSVFSRDLPPTGQVVLYIDTDATVPPAPGSTSKSDSPPFLFDRLRIQVFRGGVEEPAAASLADRDFALHEGLFAGGPVSVGVVPTPGAPDYVVRVRLFRGDRLVLGEPPQSSTIDMRVRLPAVDAEGKTSVAVLLSADDVGKPRGTDSMPLDPILGDGAPSRLGKWPGAQITPCTGAPLESEACVPGGAYWMGDPRQHGVAEGSDADRERLVVVSPFFLDLAEVTVGQLRRALPQLLAKGLRAPPSWSGLADGRSLDDWSAWTEQAPANDPGDTHAALAVNGVLWSTAHEYCQLRSADLPSEAMLEFVASGRGREREYVWGDDPPSCGDAVWGRAGIGLYVTYAGDCRSPGTVGGVLQPGSATRDRMSLEGPGGSTREIVDLAGNLLEWALDDFVPQDQGLWAMAGPLRDPVAQGSGDPNPLKAARGGSWRSSIGPLSAASRGGYDPAFTNRSIGFRCARRDTSAMP